jgi:carbonyl reductase 1
VENTIRVNYYGTLQTTRQLVQLLKPGGRIVNVASSSGALRNYPPDLKTRFLNATEVDDATKLMEDFTEAVKDGSHVKNGWPSAAYAVSKAGMIAQTRALANEYKKQEKSVLINSCHPGWVVTDMTRGKGNKTPDQGAQTPVLLALQDIGERTGTFWTDETEVDWATW